MKRVSRGIIIMVFLISIQLLDCSAQKPKPGTDSRVLLSRGDFLTGTFSDAVLADYSRAFLLASVQQKYLIRDLNTKRFMAGFPVKGGFLAFSYQDYGLTSIKEHQTTVHYALRLNPGIRCGMRILWHRQAYGDVYYEKEDYYSFAISVFTGIGKKSHAGFQIEHARTYPEVLFPPSGLRPAIRFYADHNLSSNAAVEMWISQAKGEKIMAATGIRIIHKNRFLMGAGMLMHPASFYFSTGWRIRGMMVQIRTDWHPVLGFSPETSFYAEKGGANE